MQCEIIPEANSLLQFLIIVGFLGSLAVNIKVLMGQNAKQKREVSFAESYVSQEALKALSARVEKNEDQIEAIRDKMEKDKMEILKAGEERAVKLHGRIDLGIEKVDKLMGAFSQMRRDQFDSHREGI